MLAYCELAEPVVAAGHVCMIAARKEMDVWFHCGPGSRDRAASYFLLVHKGNDIYSSKLSVKTPLELRP